MTCGTIFHLKTIQKVINLFKESTIKDKKMEINPQVSQSVEWGLKNFLMSTSSSFASVSTTKIIYHLQSVTKACVCAFSGFYVSLFWGSFEYF